MTKTDERKIPIRWRSAGLFLVVAAVLAIVGASTANARTFVSLGIGVPLYAGPPAYYGPAYYPPYYGPYYAPYAYAPAPVYYALPPVVVVPSPTSASCRSGLWRQQDGSVVNGVACLQPNGLWQLTNY